MSTRFDISQLSHELTALAAHHDVKHLAVIVPLAPGTREMAYDAIAEGPPFDPRAVGIDFHQVLLTDTEAIFVFGLTAGAETLERILASEDFWSVVGWWERIADGRPRLAHVAYEWRAA
jgi:hypothetical protein